MLITDLHKVHHGLAPKVMNGIFKKIVMTYNFKSNSTFETRNIKSIYYGSETINNIFLAPKIWKLWLINIKHSENLET